MIRTRTPQVALAFALALLLAPAPGLAQQMGDSPGVETVGQPSQTQGINDGVDQPADMQTEDLAPASIPQAPVAPAAPGAPAAPSATSTYQGTAMPGAMPGMMPGASPETSPYAGTAAMQGGQLQAGGPVSAGDPPGRVGRLSVLDGAVSLQPAEQARWVPASRNRPLIRGDMLFAAKGARAELSVGDTRVRLSENTLLALRALDNEVLQLEVRSGTVSVHVPELAQQGVIELDLPSAAVALRAAGEYRIDVPEGAAPKAFERIVVRKGSAEVRVGTASTVVGAGELLRLPKDAREPGKVASARGVDSFDGWCAERERVLAHKPALKYVSQQTAGYEDLDENGSWVDSTQYGHLWQPRVVPAGWAPFSAGHWVWIAPYGWTWIDDMPWGFAPFHYGRWVYYNSAWMWAPGAMGITPYYLPHLVSFVGGFGGGVALGLGVGAVGWYPLGWGEPFYPGFGCSYAYLHAINRPYGNVGGFVGARIPLMNRGAPNSITAISAQTMQSAQSIGSAHRTLPPSALSGAQLGMATPAVHPIAQSYAHGAAGPMHMPPPHLMARQPAPSFGYGGRAVPRMPQAPAPTSMVQQVGKPVPFGGYYRPPQIIRIDTPPMPNHAVMPMVPMYRPGVRMYEGPALGPYFHMGPDVHPSVGNPGFYGHYGAYYGGGGYYYGHPGGGGGGFFHGGHHGR